MLSIKNIEFLKKIMIRLFASFILFSWIFSVPVYVFSIFMVRKGFFSYDFFIDGVYGVNVFVVFSCILIFTVSFILFGFLIPLLLYIKSKKSSGKNSMSKFKRVCVFLVTILSVLMHVFLIVLACYSGEFIQFFGLEVAALFMVMPFLCFTLDKDKIFGYSAIVCFITVTFIVPLSFSDQLTGFIDVGLKKFKIGGDVPIVISLCRGSGECIKIDEGNLILLSPRNIYYHDSDRMLSIYSYHNDVKIDYPVQWSL